MADDDRRRIATHLNGHAGGWGVRYPTTDKVVYTHHTTGRRLIATYGGPHNRDLRVATWLPAPDLPTTITGPHAAERVLALLTDPDLEDTMPARTVNLTADPNTEPADAYNPATRTEHVALAEVVRDRRILLGLSQETLARLAGSDRQSINRVEGARYTPSFYRVVRLARALELTPVKLMELVEIRQRMNETRSQAGDADAGLVPLGRPAR